MLRSCAFKRVAKRMDAALKEQIERDALAARAWFGLPLLHLPSTLLEKKGTQD